MKNNPVPAAERCVQFVEGYGMCEKPRQHVVHAMLGVSPVEHPFVGPATKNVEEMRLSRRNVKRIAARSGKSVDELETMRQVAKKQGRVLTLRYEVVHTPTTGVLGFRADRVIVDEINESGSV